MPATQAFSHVLGINNQMLSREENQILEAELFMRIVEELKEIFRQNYQNFFLLMHFTIEMENAMIEANFIRLVIKDILLTEDYTLEGISRYADIPEEVMHDLPYGVLKGDTESPYLPDS